MNFPPCTKNQRRLLAFWEKGRHFNDTARPGFIEKPHLLPPGKGTPKSSYKPGPITPLKVQ